MKKNAHYQALVEELALGNCVLFIGAGLSMGAGLPGWGLLLQYLDEALGAGLGPPRGNFLDYAEKLDMAVGRVKLGCALNDVLNGPGVSPSPVHHGLLSLPLQAVFTTNYEYLIEHTLDALEIRYDAIRYDEEVGVIDQREALPVIKFHGDLEDPPGIVITGADYAFHHMRHPAFTPLFEAMLATRTFLFVGFSLTDNNFLALNKTVQRALGRYRRNAYAVVVEDHPGSSPEIDHFTILGVPMTEIDRFLIQLAEDAKRLLDPWDPPPDDVVRRIERRVRSLPKRLFQFSDLEKKSSSRVLTDSSVREDIYQILHKMKRFGPRNSTLWTKLGVALYRIGDYRASLRAFGQASVKDKNAARTIARCHWALDEKWRTRRILERLIYLDGDKVEIDLNYVQNHPDDVALFAHTCNWEATEHLERKRFHRTVHLARKGLSALDAWVEHGMDTTENNDVWKFIHNHIGRGRLLLLQAGEDPSLHLALAEKAFLKAIHLAKGGFPQAWSNLLDLYKEIGDVRRLAQFRELLAAKAKKGVLKRLKKWHPNMDWQP